MQQQDTISVGQALLIGSIPAAIALLGVIATVIVGQWRAAKAWKEERAERQKERDHQRELERDRLLRAERIALYRRLAQAAGDVLVQSGLSVWPGRDDHEDYVTKFEGPWTGALAEVQMIGAWSVVEVAQTIEQVRKDRNIQMAMRRWRDERAEEEGSPSPSLEEQSKQEHDDGLNLFQRLFNQNNERLTALITACRDDIASLRQ